MTLRDARGPRTRSGWVALAALCVLVGPPAVAAPGGPRPARYIVTLADTADVPATAAEHARRHSAQVHFLYRHAVHGYAATLPPGIARNLERDSRVVRVEPDAEVTAAEVPTGVRRIRAHLSPTAAIDGLGGDVDADIAILDTGVDASHPDLNVAGSTDCTGEGDYDGNGHGTHVAGVAAARDDGVGAVGVAPGARIWSVKVLDRSGRGTWSQVICGVDWVTANAATIDVANMSLSGDGVDGTCSVSALRQAICRSVAKGVTYTVAAGNASKNAATVVPATYGNVITVSAIADSDGLHGGGAWPATACRTDQEDTFFDLSNYGGDIDLTAPGVCITSTWPGGGYATISGTSMAAPHIAGTAALYLTKRPDATPAQVRKALHRAGSSRWNAVDDPDGIKERLVDAAKL